MIIMKEYEYSFVVDSAEQYHAFCEDEQPLKVEFTSMRRRVFKDGSTVIARLTEESIQGVEHKYFDFKEDSKDSQLVKHVHETSPIDISQHNIEHYQRLMNILDFRLDADLIKKRTRYQFKDVHIDIDEYTSPRHAVVVEIEGKQRAANKFYKHMRSTTANK